MNKQTALLLTAAALSLSLTACGGDTGANSGAVPPAPTQQLPAATDPLAAAAPVETPAPIVNPVPTAPADTAAAASYGGQQPAYGEQQPVYNGQQPAQNTGSYIGDARAREIALGVTGGGTVVKCQLDYEDDYGIYVYEVEIRNGNWEWDVEINAASGAVIKTDKDWD